MLLTKEDLSELNDSILIFKSKGVYLSRNQIISLLNLAKSYDLNILTVSNIIKKFLIYPDQNSIKQLVKIGINPSGEHKKVYRFISLGKIHRIRKNPLLILNFILNIHAPKRLYASNDDWNRILDRVEGKLSIDAAGKATCCNHQDEELNIKNYFYYILIPLLAIIIAALVL